MYILFEKQDYGSNEDIFSYDAIGYAETESEAYRWLRENAAYRVYKYCPANTISYH